MGWGEAKAIHEKSNQKLLTNAIIITSIKISVKMCVMLFSVTNVVEKGVQCLTLIGRKMGRGGGGGCVGNPSSLRR